jgi:hypothetical protein
MSILWKNWPVHNIISHPLSEVLYWLTFWFAGDKISGWVHDVTIPAHEAGLGRG